MDVQLVQKHVKPEYHNYIAQQNSAVLFETAQQMDPVGAMNAMYTVLTAETYKEFWDVLVEARDTKGVDAALSMLLILGASCNQLLGLKDTVDGIKGSE